jgi:hypothetical protein
LHLTFIDTGFGYFNPAEHLVSLVNTHPFSASF